MAPSAEAAKKKRKPKKVTRTAEITYTGSTPYVARRYVSVNENNIAGGTTPSGSKEVYVTVAITDQSGRKVAGKLVQDSNGNGTTSEAGEPAFEFCGSIDKPVKIQPGVPVGVYINTGPCGSDVSVPTTGTVKFTFSNIP